MITTRVFRNDPCPCRSGKKYKNCCLRAQPASIENRLSRPPSAPQDNGIPVSFIPRPAQPAPRPAISSSLKDRDWQEVHVTLDEPTGDLVCGVMLYSREWLQSRNVVVGGPIQLCIPQYQVFGQGQVVAIKPSAKVPQGEGLVVGFVRQKRNEAEANLPPLQKREWQQVHIKLDEPDGTQVYVVMLQSREWLRLNNGIIGEPVYLDLPHHEVHGHGRIVFVEPSPVISDCEGRVMTVVRSQGGENGKADSAPMPSPLCRAGVRTYFGEKLPPIGHGWLQIDFQGDDGGVLADMTLTRSEEWFRANLAAVEELRKSQDLPTEIEQWRLIRVFMAAEKGKWVHLAVFWPQTWVQAHGLAEGEPVLLRLAEHELFGDGRLVAIDPAPFVPQKGERKGMIIVAGRKKSRKKEKIATTEVGDYVTTYTSEELGEDPPLDDSKGEWISRERIHFHLEKEDGNEVRVVLLRDKEWVESEGIEAGGSVYLDMPEQGTRGWAKVEAVVPCLVFRHLDAAGSQMVTGTFRHSEGWAGDLVLKGESEPIAVTPGHLFWSVDREDWVPVGELEPGETVKTIKGTTTVVSYTMRDHPEPVFNLEVEHDHVFRVGDQGILVHNTSNPCCSGLSNTGSLTPIMNVSVGGRNVPIYGDGQRTGMINCPNGTNKHTQTAINIARTAAATGDYEYFTLNRAWSTSTGGASSDGRRPDVIGVRCDGRVYSWEAISATDDPMVLQARVNAGMATLPVANRGMTFVVPLMC